ncbi:hypothetical protein [Planctomicrobium piriforme]|uniref:Uncharacterized protein n=1 Tax=Planctomicrobium piriforme TaxID=1576369 RepID=A0A1I3SPH8_9PLAN|nr:hypothetical protein [Planctomicrobium piriforme]SFJ60082.1 hypothetical protein SAMN05421753_12513 [Planctomicrobium piriforme]
MQTTYELQDVEWISSRRTFLYKFGFTGIALLLCLGAVFLSSEISHFSERGGYAIVGGSALAFFLWTFCEGGQLKKVGLVMNRGRRSIVISNFLKTIIVDADAVSSVKGFSYLGTEQQIVTFQGHNDFGDWIVFLPRRISDLPPWRDHPDVQRLNKWVGDARLEASED